MNSTFLNQIGLGSFDLGYLFPISVILGVIAIAAIVLLIIQICKVNKLKGRLDKFLLGKDGTSLEQDIVGLCEDNKFLKNSTEKNKKDIRNLYKNADYMELEKTFSAYTSMMNKCLKYDEIFEADPEILDLYMKYLEKTGRISFLEKVKKYV